MPRTLGLASVLWRVPKSFDCRANADECLWQLEVHVNPLIIMNPRPFASHYETAATHGVFHQDSRSQGPQGQCQSVLMILFAVNAMEHTLWTPGWKTDHRKDRGRDLIEDVPRARPSVPGKGGGIPRSRGDLHTPTTDFLRRQCLYRGRLDAMRLNIKTYYRFGRLLEPRVLR